MNWLIKTKRCIAWYKACATRTYGYVNLYNAIGITVVLFETYSIPKKYIPIGIISILAAILVIGSLDILLGVLEEETKLFHIRSPILMEILKQVTRKDDPESGIVREFEKQNKAMDNQGDKE
jgi:hypothetical protein